MTQAQIVAHVQVTHDPLGTPSVESYDTPVMTWDGVTVTDHAASMTVAVAGNGVQIYNGVRQVESTTKVDALSGIDGRSTPVRDKDSTSAGTAGLFLLTVTLNDEASASDALSRVNAAQARVMRQTQYFASVHKAYSVQNNFEGKLIDQLNTGIGNLVDADMASEGAKLQAAQTRRQLNVVGLSISNRLPHLLLSLFAA